MLIVASCVIYTNDHIYGCDKKSHKLPDMKRTHVPNDDPLGPVDTLLLDTCTVLREERNLELQDNIASLQKTVQKLCNNLFWARYSISKIKKAWHQFVLLFKDRRHPCSGQCPYKFTDREAFTHTMPIDCPRHVLIFDVLAVLKLTWITRKCGFHTYDLWTLPDNQKRTQFQLAVANGFSIDANTVVTLEDYHFVLNLPTPEGASVVSLGTRLTNANVGAQNASSQELKALESLILLTEYEWEIWTSQSDNFGLPIPEIVAKYLKKVDIPVTDLHSRCYPTHLRDYLGWDDLLKLNTAPKSEHE